MGFDGAATFSGKKTGVQARLKQHAPHALFVHCHCHMLQLARVQTANSTTGIKHVYVTITTIWKYFHSSPKRTQSLKEIQQVLELPELKEIKPSDTRWLAHERCIKAVKASYTSLVVTFESNHQNFHEPEALGLHKSLSQFNTIAAIYLLDYVLPNITKLSKTLQKEQLDLSMISILVDSVLESLEDAITPVANWVLELMDANKELEKVTAETINWEKIERFQAQIGSPFIACIKANISNRFASQEILSALSIFDLRKVPSSESDKLSTYGNKSIQVLLDHFGKDMPAITLNGDETLKSGLVSSTEWATFCSFLAKKPKDDIKSQLAELITNDTLATMFPSLHKIASIRLTIPVSTASVERSFSQIKLIKTRLKNSLNDIRLSHLMKIAIQSPEVLSEIDLETIVNIWYRKPCRLSI